MYISFRGPDFVPSTHIKMLTSIYSSRVGASDTPFWPLWALHSHLNNPNPQHTHASAQITKLKFKATQLRVKISPITTKKWGDRHNVSSLTPSLHNGIRFVSSRLGFETMLYPINIWLLFVHINYKWKETWQVNLEFCQSRIAARERKSAWKPTTSFSY